MSTLTISGAIAVVDCASAQITPDGTLGAESSVVTPQTPGSTDVISGGATRGANLFHSFEQFSVLTGRTASFNNALDIQNIISRVTGSSISNIDGLLRANGTANLFLLNPNGINFGANARLSIGGSFVGSTASSLNFADGNSFSATAPQTTPLLTISVPTGLQYGGTAGNIVNQSTLNNSRTLALVGGDVRLDGGILTAPAGRVELGAVAGAGTVGLNVAGNNLSLSYPDSVERADVSLTNNAIVGVLGGGGSIAVNARNLDISGESSLFAGIVSGGTANSRAGNIEINATDRVRISGEPNAASSIFNLIGFLPGSTALGSAGDIVINTGSLEGIGSFFIGSAIAGQGNAGNVTIQARDSVFFVGSGGGINILGQTRTPASSSNGVFSFVTETGIGNGADINIQARSLSLNNGASLITATTGQGNAGNIQVNATESVSVSDGSFVEVGSTGQGNGGNINFQTRSLSLNNGALLDSSSLGQGKTGSIFVQASDVSIADSYILNLVGTLSVENGSDINIQARSLSTNNATLFTSTLGQGNAGNIQVNATESVSFSNGSNLSAFTLGQGDAGNVTIEAGGTVSFDGVRTVSLNGVEVAIVPSGVATIVGVGSVTAGSRGGLEPRTVAFLSELSDAAGLEPGLIATGNGGDIRITAGSLSLTDGAQLGSSTVGQGDAGSVFVQTNDSVSLAGSGTLISSAVESGAEGKGGNINIQSRSLSVTGGAELAASSRGQGNAGNIQVNATDSVELSGVAPFPVLRDDTPNRRPGGVSSGLFTNTEAGASGQGGDLSVTTGNLRISDGAVLTARSRSSSSGGNINVNANVLEVTGGGQLLTTAFSSGDAGNITVNVADRITISGSDPTFFERFNSVAGVFGEELAELTIDPVDPASGLFANTTSNSTGLGGDIRIAAGQLNIRDEAQVTVSSEGAGDAGNLEVAARSIRLEDQASLSSDTTAGQGNIFLGSGDLVLRRGSNITTNARGTASGGNITIDTELLAALENSDISANAQEARGGRVIINASGIFGTEFRDQLTSLSDITATSNLGVDFSGTVELNTPDVDPSQGLVILPTDLVDVTGLIAAGCPAGVRQGQSKFIVTGRGGLPLSPSDSLRSDAVEVNLVTLNPKVENRGSISTRSTAPAPAPIVEATGWVIGSNGEVILTASAPTITPHSPWQTPNECRALKSTEKALMWQPSN